MANEENVEDEMSEFEPIIFPEMTANYLLDSAKKCTANLQLKSSICNLPLKFSPITVSELEEEVYDSSMPRSSTKNKSNTEAKNNSSCTYQPVRFIDMPESFGFEVTQFESAKKCPARENKCNLPLKYEPVAISELDEYNFADNSVQCNIKRPTSTKKKNGELCKFQPIRISEMPELFEYGDVVGASSSKSSGCNQKKKSELSKFQPTHLSSLLEVTTCKGECIPNKRTKESVKRRLTNKENKPSTSNMARKSNVRTNQKGIPPPSPGQKKNVACTPRNVTRNNHMSSTRMSSARMSSARMSSVRMSSARLSSVGVSSAPKIAIQGTKQSSSFVKDNKKSTPAKLKSKNSVRNYTRVEEDTLSHIMDKLNVIQRTLNDLKLEVKRNTFLISSRQDCESYRTATPAGLITPKNPISEKSLVVSGSHKVDKSQDSLIESSKNLELSFDLVLSKNQTHIYKNVNLDTLNISLNNDQICIENSVVSTKPNKKSTLLNTDKIIKENKALNTGDSLGYIPKDDSDISEKQEKHSQQDDELNESEVITAQDLQSIEELDEAIKIPKQNLETKQKKKCVQCSQTYTRDNENIKLLNVEDSNTPKNCVHKNLRTSSNQKSTPTEFDFSLTETPLKNFEQNLAWLISNSSNDDESLDCKRIVESPGNTSLNDTMKSTKKSQMTNFSSPDVMSKTLHSYNELKKDNFLCTPKMVSKGASLMTPGVKLNNRKFVSRKIQEQLYSLNQGLMSIKTADEGVETGQN